MFSDLFSDHSIVARILQAVIIGVIAFLILFLLDRIVERVSPKVSKRVDVITTSENVLRLRRAETFMGLTTAIIRILVVMAAIFTIWYLNSPTSGPIALVGVGTLVIVIGGATIGPLLRDMTYGFIMIAERWYGVGDHVVFEPYYGNNGGIVERMTLRSTKLRSVNGEAIWMHHQHIQGVHVTSAASHPLVVETFVNDPVKGRKIVQDAIDIMPTGATTIPQPLQITEVKKVKPKIWRITAVCEITPFREWIIGDFTIEVIKKNDQMSGEDPVIVYGPLNYYASDAAEKRYHRSAKARQRVRNGASKPKTKTKNS